MTDDIVTRLQKSENLLRLSEVRSINAVDVIQLSSDMHEAADEIERLRARILLQEPRRIKEHDERIP